MQMLNPVIRRFLAVSAVALALPLSAHAQEAASQPVAHCQADRPHGFRQHVPSHEERRGPLFLLHGLDLSAAQQSQIKALAEAQRAALETHRQSMQELHATLQTLALADKYDATAVAAKAEQLGHAAAEMARVRADGLQKVYALLTPEQRARFQQRMGAQAPCGKDRPHGR